MANILNSHFRTGKLRPVSLKFFSTYAKHLSRLTGDSYHRTRETLARIYGYKNCHELQEVMKQSGVAGPFDDDIPINEFNSKEVREAIEDRNARAMHFILEANKERYEKGAVRPTLTQLYILQLFSSPKVHLQGFKDLALPKTTASERLLEREKYLPLLREGDNVVETNRSPRPTTSKDSPEVRSGDIARSSKSIGMPIVTVKHKKKRQYTNPKDV